MNEQAELLNEIEMTEPEKKLSELFIFSKVVLKHKDLTKLHMGWFQALLENQFMLLLAPRGHLKSTVVTTCYALWRLVQDHNMRILIVNETLGVARKLLEGIKQHILGNEVFRERYGAWDQAASKWTEDVVVIPRTNFLKEPSLSAGGVLGNLVSLHNDLIILDDPISNNNCYTPHLRQKILTWFTNVILPALEPEGQLVLVGTRWHAMDLYGHILEDAGFKHWKKIVQSAEWRDEQGNRRILFPERFSAEKLDELKGTMGSVSYYCQMLNDVSGQEGSDFKIEWLRSCRYTERPKDMNVYIGVDPASGGRSVNSRFAYVVAGIPKGEKDVYVLDAHKTQLTFPEQINTIKRLCRIYEPNLMFIENNAYQQALVQALQADEETRTRPIKGYTTQGDKHRRIRTMTIRFENGTIRLPENLPDLDDELLQFPFGKDDLLDALFISLEAVTKGKTPARISYVEDYP